MTRVFLLIKDFQDNLSHYMFFTCRCKCQWENCNAVRMSEREIKLNFREITLKTVRISNSNASNVRMCNSNAIIRTSLVLVFGPFY